MYSLNRSYIACIALTGAIRGTSKEKISVKNGDWTFFEIDAGVESFAFFCKVLQNENPNIHNIPFANTKHEFFENSFLSIKHNYTE